MRWRSMGSAPDASNHPDTPIHPYSTVKFRKRHVKFQDLLLEFRSPGTFATR